jgi:hypothetical protein
MPGGISAGSNCRAARVILRWPDAFTAGSGMVVNWSTGVWNL